MNRLFQELGIKSTFKYWIYEECLEVLKDCSSLQEIRKNHRSAFDYLTKTKQLDKFLKELNIHKKNESWTYEKCLEKIKGCETQNQVRLNYPGVLDYLRKTKQKEKLFQELGIEKEKQSWTYEKCLNLFNGCKTKTEMVSKKESAVDYLRRNELLDQLCLELNIPLNLVNQYGNKVLKNASPAA